MTEPKLRLNLEIPKSLAKELEHLADTEGRTRTGIIKIALRAYFQNHEAA